MANLDLYVAPYEQPGTSSVDGLADDFGRITIPDHQRRESFPVCVLIIRMNSTNLVLSHRKLAMARI